MRNAKWLWLALVSCAVLAIGPAAHATTYNLTFGAPYAAGSFIDPSTAEQYLGNGSWYEQYPSAKTEIYVDPAAQFGATFTIDDIAGITYHTVNDGTNPSGVDFYMLIYTMPEGVDDDAVWYNKRINSEPYLSNSYVPPTADVWNAWSTGAGSNQLTFFDANNCGNFGFYGAPTLADLQAGAINWSTWPTNPTQGASDPNPKDYGSKSVLYLNWSTGSGWPAFAGYLDAIEINLTNGDTYIIDLEAKTDPVYVDSSWTGTAPGVEVEPGKFFGWNAFDKIQDGVNNVSGSTVYVAAGTYEEQVEITSDVTIEGAGAGATIIKSPVTMTKLFVTAGPNNNYPVVYVHDAANVIVRNLTVDGAGRGNTNYRMEGFGYRNAGGTIENCEIKDIRNNPINGGQHGVGIYAYADNGTARALNVLSNDVHGFQKNAMALIGANLYANVDGNTLTGAGAVSFIAQNGIQVSGGAAADITGNTISGIAYTPATYSAAGMLLYGAASPLDVIGNTVNECMLGIWLVNCDGTVSGNSLTNTAVGMGATPYWWQIVADPGTGEPRQPKAQPVDGDLTMSSTKSTGSEIAAAGVMALSTTVTRNTVAGGGNGSGIEADALGTETLTFVATENQVSGCEASFVLYKDAGATLNADLYNNSSSGSNFAVANQSGVMQDASGNWWGDSDPANVALLMDGGNSDYSPWLGGGTDTDLGTAGFQGDFSVLWADDDSPQTAAENTIQEAINMVSGSTVYVAAGSYVGNLVITVPVALIGAGEASTFVYPSLSAPNPGGAGSMPPGSSNMVLVQADDVSITGITFDGDNTSLTSAYNVGGANLDARNGIITNHTMGVYNNLTVDHCTVKNIYLRGVYASSGGTFNFHHNTVDNVQAEYASIGMFNFGGSGIFDNNTASNCNDAISSNWSRGCTFTNNTVTSSGSGIHTDNAGNYAGSTADLIENNNISNSPAGGYGIFVFAPYIAPTVNLNTITDVDVALTCAGAYAAVTVNFTNNIANGMGRANSAGIYVTTDIWGYASGDVSTHFENNEIRNFTEGAYLVAEAGKSHSTTLLNNDFIGNGLGISNGVGMTYSGPPNVGGVVNATLNVFANTANATDNRASNYYDQNCWSDYNGVGSYPVGGAGANVDNNPNTDCGLDMSPDDILYLCSGDFTFDVGIGEAVSALDAAELHFTYPAEFAVSSVTAADANYFIFYTQTSLGAGQIDTLKVNLGVLTGVEDGPASLFTVAMNGSASCLAADIEMIFRDLRDSTNAPITVPLAGPVHVVTDCADPDVSVTAPASGGLYGTSSPMLDIAANDDCALEEVYYQLDGCVGAGWIALGTALPGTTFNLTGWAVPGYAGLADGLHCLYFMAVDDQGRKNVDTCTYSWCFTKDATPPPPPTNLTAMPGHNKVHLSWTNAASDFDHTVIMRADWYAGGHEYPEYDDNNPEGPYPPDVMTGDQVYSGTASAHIDTDDLSNATRDVYHYAAFTVDAAGNVSAPSTGARSTSYWLGDVTDNPMSVGSFDGYVYYQDLAIFSNTFGLNHGDVGYENDFDIGPTYNSSPKGIPTTDNKVQFEDLAIFAINFDAVDPLSKVAPIFAATNTNGPLAMGMRIEETASDELTVRVMLRNNPDAAKSIHFVIPSTDLGLKMMDARMSDELSASVMPVFFNAREVDGHVDVSLALLGGETSIGGSGDLAIVRFKRASAGPVTLSFDEIDLRDGENNKLDALTELAQVGYSSPLPTTYALSQNYPNPFNAGTVINYQVPSTGDVSIIVYNVAGQVVRVLFHGQREQGQYSVTWDGTDDNGNHVSSGMYLYRINAGRYTASRKMVLVK